MKKHLHSLLPHGKEFLKTGFWFIAFLLCAGVTFGQQAVKLTNNHNVVLQSPILNNNQQTYGLPGSLTPRTLAEGDECDQVTLGNNFENGFGNLHILEFANDVVVNAGEIFTLNSLSFQLFVNPGYSVNGAKITIYEDSGNGPGAEITSFESITPSSEENIGEAFGFDALKVTFDFDESVTLNGSSADMIYWAGVLIEYTGENSYMEVTSDMNTPNEIYFLEDGTWVSSEDSSTFDGLFDGVMSFMGICSSLGECAGQPEAGSLGEDFSVCLNTGFALTPSGVTQATGLSFSWEQKSPDDEEWTVMEGEESILLSIGGITEETQYRMIVECESSELSNATEPITVSLKPADECGCIPIYSTGCSSGDTISNVSLDGENVNLNNSTGCSAGAYGDYTDMDAPDLIPGENYTISVSTSYGSPTYEQVKIWIDYNQNGSFESSEMIADTNGAGLPGGTGNFEFSVPETIEAGFYRVRVRLVYGSTAMGFTECSSETYGETEDYMIEVIQLDDCEGEVTAGEIAEESMEICANIPFLLTVSGASDPAEGLTRIWQTSPDGENDWEDISGANSSNYTHQSGIDEPAFFRYMVQCNDDEPDYSDVIEIIIKPAEECYCIPVGTNSTYLIDSFTTTNASQNITNTSSGFSDGGYGDFTEMVVSQVPGGDVAFSAQMAPSSYTYGFRIWVDWNQDGQFDPVTEVVYQSASYSSSHSGEFTVPDDALTGPTVMRIANHYLSSVGDIDPCATNHTNGEFEDYTFDVIPLVECEGPVSAGTIDQEDFGICAGRPFILSVTGASDLAEGLTRQWQSSPAGEEDWTDIEGAISTTYAPANGIVEPTDFRYVVTCTLSEDTDISEPITVSMSPGTDCYCTPTGTGNNSDEIINFTLANIDNDSAPSEGLDGVGYSDYSASVPPAILVPGDSYVASLTSNLGGGNHGAAIWIDYNDNGFFEPEEKVAFLSNIQGSQTVEFPAFTVADAPGTHRLRVMYHYNQTGDNLDSCTATSSFSEVEDYSVNIVVLEDCEGTPDAGIVQDDFDVCAGISFTVSVTEASDFATGLSRQWQSSPADEDDWTDIEGGNFDIFQIQGGITQPTDFRYVLQCEDDDPVYSEVLQVTLKPGTECYCTPTFNYGCSISASISNVTLVGESETIDESSGCSENFVDNTDITPADLAPGNNYHLLVTTGYTSPQSVELGVWIDFDQNGSFEDEGEQIFHTQGNGMGTATKDIEFSVPQDAEPGLYRLRIRTVYSTSNPFTACSTENYGETEDYNIEVIQLDECDGPVTAGTPVEDEIDICAGLPFTVGVTEASDPADGLDRQWQYSPAGEDDWTDFEGAHSNSLVVNEGVFEDTDFRYVVNCTNTGDEDISDTITVTLKPGYECYCIPTYTYGCNSNDTINNVSLVGESVSLDNDSGCSDNFYADYTEDESMPVPDLAPGESYTLSVHTNYGSPTFEEVRAWIDYNKNGNFEPSEEIANTGGAGFPSSGTATFEFAVPEGLEADTYRMRVRLVYSGGGEIDPCANVNYGETEDYSVSIIQLDDCDGPVDAGTIAEEEFDVCGSIPFVLSVTGASDPANGLTRVWQSSPADEDDWTDITGAQTTNYTHPGINEPTKFRYKVVCTTSGDEDVSNEVLVTLKPATECYCTPTNNSNSSYYIANVSTDGALQDLDNSSTFSSGGYGDYSDSQFLVVYPGQEIDFSIQGSSGSMIYSAWLDLNQNGNFSDTGEYIFGTSSYVDTPFNATYTIPGDLDQGSYRLRIRNSWISSDLSPCGDDPYGEAEDYTVQVIFPDCFPPLDIEANFVTDVSADISWSAPEEQDSWVVYYGTQGFDPESEDAMVLEIEDEPYVMLTDLLDNTTYQVYVKAVCSEELESYLIGPIAFTTNITPPENTRLCDAIHLEPNMGCAGGPFTNIAAFEESGEPGGSCLNNFRGHNSVWFTFEAPESGHGVLSTNFSQTQFNTEMVAFEGPSDCGDMSTLGPEVACANNGNDLEFFDLNPGEIYYVKVTGFNEAEGLFCIGYSPDGDLVNVDVQVFENFTYYPNPVENELTLKAGNIIEKVNVYNLLGQEVIEVTPGTTQTLISTESLSSGTYMMKVSIDGAERTFRIIKK